ncbi:MAG: ABC transporter ATP-binding protein/permease [Bacteroidales bacterium]|nr:ABC transporter ATP-binding protein/permease [Bacteroidales bacterium]
MFSLRPYIATFKWLVSIADGYRTSVVICTVLGLLNICLGWCFVYVCKWAVDIASHTVEGNLVHVLLLLPTIMVGELAFASIISWISQVRNVHLDNRTKQYVFRHLIESEWRGIEKYHTGDVVNRIESDVALVVSFATDTLPGILVLLFQLVGSFILLLWLDATLAWIILCISPVFLLMARIYMRRMHRIVRKVRDSESSVQCQIQENLQYRAVIKTLEQADATLQRMTSVMDVLTGQVRQRARLSIITRLCMSGGFGLGYCLTFGWGVIQIWEGVIGYGTMVAFLQLAGRVQRPIADLSKEVPVLVRCFTSAERLLELVKLPREECEPQPPLGRTALGIRLQDVSFRYASDEAEQRQVLEHFSYDFKPGSSVAILGETGVGKTTLIRMLLALIRPDQGTVTLYSAGTDDAHPGEEQPLTAYSRRYMSYVPQGNTLLSGTIRSNLQMGRADATDEEMLDALHLAAADFVSTLPQALDTPCGERGGGLSEGQAQRIAIARALLRKAPILLLDEATSALDPDTEQRVLDNLLSASDCRLVVLITHRPSAAERCKEVVTVNRD